ncbi:MAG: hypothetical protein SX243_03950 [Acidobacteriota bacterium]|nr:hypothetical protein [Acidobacteriota bacterium]
MNRIRAFVLLCLAAAGGFLAVSAEGEGSLGVFRWPGAELAEPQTGYDTLQDRFVVATLDRVSPLFPQLRLDVTVEGTFYPLEVYSYQAPFLTLAYSDFEIVDVLVYGDRYTVFLNRHELVSNSWSSWVVHLDSSSLGVDWARQITAGENEYLRVRKVTHAKGGFAFVAALGDLGTEGTPTVVARLTSAGALTWAESYQLSPSVELSAISFGARKLVAGGRISDPTSSHFGEAVLLKLDLDTGLLLEAALYPDVFVERSLVLAQSQVFTSASGVLYVAARTLANDVVFFPVGSDLQAFTAARVLVGEPFYPQEFILTDFGDVRAVMRNDNGGDRLLTVPDPLVGSLELPTYLHLSGGDFPGQVELNSIDRRGAYDWDILGGYSLQSPSSFIGGKAPVIADVDEDGITAYCIRPVTLPQREAVAIQTVDFKAWSQTSEPLAAVPTVFEPTGSRIESKRLHCPH